MKFSIYRGDFTKSKNDISLQSAIDFISAKLEPAKVQEIQTIIDRARELYAAYEKTGDMADKDIYNRIKAKLPAITWSGTFTPSKRSRLSNTMFSGLIVLDIDGLTPEQMVEAEEKLKGDKFTFILFRSPSNKGLKIVVKLIYPTKDNPLKVDWFYDRSYSLLSEYYKTIYNFDIDPSGKDISRLCFLSFDKNMTYNPAAESYNSYSRLLDEYHNSESINKEDEEKTKKKNVKAGKKAQVQKLKSSGLLRILLEMCIENKVSFTYKEWATLSYIVIKEEGPDAFETFRSFSIIDKVKFDEKLCRRQFDGAVERYDDDIAPSVKKLVEILKLRGIHLDKDIAKESDVNYNDNDLPFLIAEKIGKCYKDELKGELFIKQNDNLIRLDNTIRNGMLIDIKKSYLNCRKDMFETYFESPKNIVIFNPVIDKLNSILTADCSEFNKLYKFFDFQEDVKKDVLKIQRWMLGVLSMIFNDGNNYDHMLIFVGRQDGGKTYFIRNYLLKIFKDLNHVCEKFNYEKASEADYQKMMGRNVIIFDDESTFSKKDSQMIKTVLSSNELQYIDKWEKDLSYKRRLSTFIGSTNKNEVYDDETGGKRFNIIDLGNNYLPGANVSGKIMKPEFPIDWEKVWGYIYHLYINEGLRYKDIEYVNDNAKYANLTVLEKMVKDYFEVYTISDTKELRNFRDIRSDANSIANTEQYNIKNIIDSPRGLATALNVIFKDSLIKFVSSDKKNTFYNVRIKAGVFNQFPNLINKETITGLDIFGDFIK